jgi:acyl dehydratase
MKPANFTAPLERIYFDDYVPGTVHEFGAYTVTEEELLAFAKQWDPQYLHVDRERAEAGPFGGLIASGWHTVAIVMRLSVDNYLSHVASLASPGIDELRWLQPVRSGDTIRVRATVLEARPSQSRADRGLVKTLIEAINQNDEVVMTMIPTNFVARRPQERL